MKLFKSIALGIFAAAIILISGCSKDDSGKYNVRYTFTGTSTATVTYFNSGGREVSITATPPWSYEFSTSDETQSVSVAAFSLSSGSATVNLYLNGELKKSGSDGSSYGFNATTGVYQIKDIK
ncbi:MAG: hypothetical protein U0T82_07745 [Bacteroidales bacterium]